MRTVRLAVAAVVLAAMAATAATAIGATQGAWTFQSTPRLHPAKLQLGNSPQYSKLAKGYFMLAIDKSFGSSPTKNGQVGPLIVDSHLQPVWFKPLNPRLEVTNLMVQSYGGKPALSWWQGGLTPDGSRVIGQEIVVDQRYREVATLSGRNGWVLDPHEFLISGRDAWVTAYKIIPMDLSPYGGAVGGFVGDSAVQEYDLKTGKLLYTWDARRHIPLTDSYVQPSLDASVPWDAYHVNSIQLLPGGRLVISARNTWAVYEVDAESGNVVWTLGGKHSDYAIPATAQFQWQHMATLRRDGTLTVFDDHCCELPIPPLPPARGLVLRLDRVSHSVSLVHEYRHNPDLSAVAFGSTQLLGNGNVVVGWGSQPFFSEYSPSGALLLDARMPSTDDSYRALVQRWVALPSAPPRGAAFKRNNAADVYASWNGATRVASWRVLAGSSFRHLKTVGTARKTGFETKIHLSHGAGVFEVQALDGGGHVLGTSKPFGSAGTAPAA